MANSSQPDLATGATTDTDTHIWFADGGYKACDTWADWAGHDVTGVTCTECLEAADTPVPVKFEGGGTWG